MKSPKEQRYKFNQTIEAGFWHLVEHKEAITHENLTVSTTTDWCRDFKARKNPQQILKSARNLLLRAAEYADVLEMDALITIGDNPPETFSHYTAQASDYFKTKSYR
ncbi:MAG: hypothetical protein HN580_08525 [Deltaproteobacteria bacterium]|nr:hypothetical protein [Deltaproteobacteria bacterium]MBT7484580.1 hypothetical protein [Candidatus Peregrinibacteria bacterium]MBT4268719.1 hypothetical protein [Deltaproteobacteria bacterium]MBT4638393.1 hypothetical protein [Deltaproteobacteria bacterium]MBT6500241.1 hypothetical protein [Deltaproteobacteria bacterium]